MTSPNHPRSDPSAANPEQPGLDASLLCRLLQAAAANAGLLRLATESAERPEVAAVLRFLAEQRWLEADRDAATWRLTPIGRLWIEDLSHSPYVKFHRHDGELFLLHWDDRETVVWRRGRFATITVPFGFRERYEVRLEMDPVTTAAGTEMADALAAACRLLAGHLRVPPPSKPERLETRMHRFLDGL